jgi:hypothetical protein
MTEIETLVLFLLVAVIAHVVAAATVFSKLLEGQGNVAQFMKSQETEDLKKKVWRGR